MSSRHVFNLKSDYRPAGDQRLTTAAATLAKSAYHKNHPCRTPGFRGDLAELPNYANAAIKANSHRLALHLLKSLLYYKNNNYLAYEMLIEVYRQMNDMAKYYEAKADLYYLLAIYPKAIDELNMALNQLANNDELENRRLESKKKQWKTEFTRLKQLN